MWGKKKEGTDTGEHTRGVGQEKEELAAEFLKRHGYEILEMNYRCRRGEIDIVARSGGYLVFVEVKYRGSGAAGLPVEAVDRRKQQRISYTARHYLMTHGLGWDMPVRFDVVAILGNRIRLYPNAFEYME